MAEQSNTRQVSFTLDSFKKANASMIATNDAAYTNWASRYGNRLGAYDRPIKDYTSEEIQKIIDSGSILQQAALSRTYFAKDGFYKRILIYYGTLLKYCGILIPNPAYGKSLQTEHIAKRYFQATDFYERMNLAVLATNMAMRTLIDGSYYGVIQSMDKQTFAVLDLPHAWCKSNFKDKDGNDIIEFNVSYFDTIIDADQRKAALNTYPKEISSYYKSWEKSKAKSSKTSWMFISTEISIFCQFLDGRPLFLHIIPSTLEYDDSISRETEREIDEIKKIIVQKVPHLNDGTLVFEPDEAKEMHDGSVKMLKTSNPNVSILTTYADVDVISSKASAEGVNSNNSTERMKNNIYTEAGVSPQVFAATGNIALEVSLKSDLSLMMILGNKIGLFVTNIINRLYANTNINFKFTLLPISYYNDKEYAEESYKMINTGYSLILPALAMGLSQRDLGNLKDLENDVLKLTEKLLPPLSASTMGDAAEAGRPGIGNDKKADKTIKNQSGGGGNE